MIPIWTIRVDLRTRFRKCRPQDATFPDAGAFGAIDPDINSTRAQSWNVIVERQIGSVVAGVGELSRKLAGSHLGPGAAQSRRLPRSGPVHAHNGVSYPVCSTTANLQQRRALSLENAAASGQLGTIDQHAAVGTQDYRALRLSLQRRAASGLRLSGNYTRSYCFGNTAQLTFGQVGQRLPEAGRPVVRSRQLHPGPAAHRATSRSVRRRRSSRTRAVRALASNWNVSGIINARSGTLAHRDDGQGRRA